MIARNAPGRITVRGPAASGLVPAIRRKRDIGSGDQSRWPTASEANDAHLALPCSLAHGLNGKTRQTTERGRDEYQRRKEEDEPPDEMIDHQCLFHADQPIRQA